MTLDTETNFEKLRLRTAHADAADYLYWSFRTQRRFWIEAGAADDLTDACARLAITIDDLDSETLERFDSVLEKEAFGQRAFWAALCDERIWQYRDAAAFLETLLNRFPRS